MFDTSLKNQFFPMWKELYQAILAAWSFRRKFEMLPVRLRTETRETILEELTALRSLANEVVLRLCSLDDDKSPMSFHGASKELHKRTLDKSSQLKIKSSVKAYRDAVNELKTKHRNRYIAHLSGDNYPDQFAVLEMVKGWNMPLLLALETLELFMGQKQFFQYRLGSVEGEIDLVSQLGLVSSE